MCNTQRHSARWRHRVCVGYAVDKSLHATGTRDDSVRACAHRRDRLDDVSASYCSLHERQSGVARRQGAPTCNRAAALGELDLR